MKKNLVFLLLLFIILLKIDFVSAKDITVDDVVTYMNGNSIFNEQDYAKLFGNMFNGSGEYDITKFSYTVSREEDTLKVKVYLENQKVEEKNKEEMQQSVEDETLDKSELP